MRGLKPPQRRPKNASAFAAQVRAISGTSGVTGSGTVGQLAKWTGAHTLGDGGTAGGGGGTPQGHELDADTIGLWHCAWADLGADATGNYPLTPTSMDTAPSPIAGQGAYFANGTAPQMVSSAIGANAADWLGDLTVEVLALIGENSGASRFLSVDAVGETEATNTPVLFGHNSNANSTTKLNVFWEHDAGLNVSLDTRMGLGLLSQFAHYAMVRSGTDVSVYVNGQLMETMAGGAAPSGGSSSCVVLGNSLSTVKAFGGVIADVRASKVARTAAEILASYKRCFGLA